MRVAHRRKNLVKCQQLVLRGGFGKSRCRVRPVGSGRLRGMGDPTRDESEPTLELPSLFRRKRRSTSDPEPPPETAAERPEPRPEPTAEAAPEPEPEVDRPPPTPEPFVVSPAHPDAAAPPPG